MPFWNTTSTTLGNEQMVVNNTYKDADGNNKLTTITTTNSTGYKEVVPGDTKKIGDKPPGLKGLSYAVQKDGEITYKYDDGMGTTKEYNSIQNFANSSIVGYNANTTKRIKDSMQKNLVAAIEDYNTKNSTTKIGPSTPTVPPPPSPPLGGGPTPADINNAGIDLTNINIPPGIEPDQFGNFKYPLDLASSKQDRIKFTLFESQGADIKGKTEEIFNPNFSGKIINRKISKDSLGSVYLPIQPSISDSNTVEWSGATLNGFQAAAFGKSLDLMAAENSAAAAAKIANSIAEFAKGISADGGNNSVAQALKVFLAQEAIGIQGVLSRASGAILNPNLELLFSGPQLRPFNFTFRLSPREEKEATEVRKIIRFFKKGMAVRTAKSNLFLKAPHIFKIQYQVGDTGDDHKSLNRIKNCALLSCDVDYTPDGTYMTFNDPARTLTSYQLSLRFSELDPVLDEDYTPIASDEIGF